MSDNPSRSGVDTDDTLDPARETGKGKVRSAVADELRNATPHAGARESASSAGRGARSGFRRSGGGGDTGASARNILGGIGLMGVIVLIIIAVVIYLLLR